MDELRARAYLDLLLGKDSRPRPGRPAAGRRPARARPAAGWTAARGPAGAVPAGFAGRVNLTAPLATLAGLADRPGELAGLGPVDPWLARDLAAAAARQPEDHLVRDRDRRARATPSATAAPGPNPGQATRHTRRARPAGTPGSPSPRPAGTARPAATAPGRCAPPDPARTCSSPSTRSPPSLRPPVQSPGHDPGVKLRHLSQVRHATCTSPICRRPAAQCDFEHNIPYEAGGRTCLCNSGPKCRHDHRLKQHPRWQSTSSPTGPSAGPPRPGGTYTTEPTRYPI